MDFFEPPKIGTNRGLATSFSRTATARRSGVEASPQRVIPRGVPLGFTTALRPAEAPLGVMILGQSAATAASMAIDDRVPAQKVDDAKLRAQLLHDGQVMEWVAAAGK